MDGNGSSPNCKDRIRCPEDCRKQSINCTVTMDESTNNHAAVLKALEIPVILDCIFKFLPLNDIKNCRLINLCWLDSTKFRFAQNSRLIIFNNRFGIPTTKHKRMPLISNHLFRSITFNLSSNNAKTKWVVSKFESQLESFKKITDLKLNNVTLIKDRKELLVYCLNLDIFAALHKLTVVGVLPRYDTAFDFKLENLIKIKYLTLGENCRLSIGTSGSRISPIELTLDRAEITDIINMPNGIINHIINFDSTECVFLHFTKQDVKIDMSQKKEMKSLTLDSVRVVSLENVNWTPKELIITDYDFIFPHLTTIKFCNNNINKFSLTCNYLNVSCIPTNIEWIELDVINVYTNQAKKVFKNLLNIKFNGTEIDVLRTIFSLMKCPKLSSLEISVPISSNTLWRLPKQIRSLKLINDGSKMSCKLEKLVMSFNTYWLRSNLRVALSSLKKLNAKLIILNLDGIDENVSLSQLVEMLPYEVSYSCVVAGPIFSKYWKTEGDEVTEISPYEFQQYLEFP